MSFQVTVYLNADRGASLGLNTALERADNERGYERVTTPCSHRLIPVITFGWENDREPNLDDLYQWFNIGAAENDAQAVKLLVDEYCSRRNRSLSVGDVGQIGDRFFACASAGWDEVPAPPALLTAAKAVREAFDLVPGEPLSVTNPISPVNHNVAV